MTTVRYFAYGSNMQAATFRGRRKIAFLRAVAARAAGWRLVLDKPSLLPSGHSFANIVPSPGDEVLGVVYEIGEDDLAHIDLTEGVRVGNYRRIEIPIVALPTAERLIAHTLVSDRRDAALLPSTRYMALLIEGAIENGLPESYVDWLRGLPATVENEEAARARAMIDGFLRQARDRDE